MGKKSIFISIWAVIAIFAGIGLSIELDRGSSARSGVAGRAPSTVGSESQPHSQGAFAIVADLQRTLLLERIFMLREQNDPERECLVRNLARQRIDFVAILGDLVGWNTRGNWRYFDRLTEPLRSAGIPVYPLLGNHDYLGDQGNYFARFPWLARTSWFAHRYQGVELIWLNSNLSKLSDAERRAEVEWYEERLREAESSPSVRGVLVFAHHAVFTNSTVTGDDEEIRGAFLPGFYRSTKTMAYVSGHAHAYEHFIERGKTFVVSGGGGGPRVKLLEGASRRHEDLFHAPSPRPFHYLLVRPAQEGLGIEVRGFPKGGCDETELDYWAIPWPNSK